MKKAQLLLTVNGHKWQNKHDIDDSVSISITSNGKIKKDTKYLYKRPLPLCKPAMPVHAAPALFPYSCPVTR